MDWVDSDSSDYDSDDDPTFDLLEEETRSTLSKLSIKKHNSSKDMSARRNVSKALEESVEEEQDEDKTDPKLGEKDQRSYETIQKTIKAGQIEKLKVEQCKIYLRKHALRLTGSKDTLIQRIKEHTEYFPDFSLFRFSIASRSATGPPCGTRIVAGRIVKESYGAKKQQHTFTVEVLWSKGEKPLPPLHPLLIKGRNLYRLKTLRQKWDDEAERLKILSEKHARGSVARSNRETRVQEKEMHKLQRENRVSTGYKEKKSVAEKQLHSLSMNSVNKKDQPQVEVVDNSQKDEQKECRKFTNVIQENVFPNQRQPLTNVNLNDPSSYRERQQGFGESYTSNPSKIPLRVYNSNMHMPIWRGSSYGGNTNNYNSLSRMHDSNAHNIPTYSDGGYNNCNTSRSPLHEHGHMYTYGHSQNMNWQARNGWCNAGAAKRPFQGQCEEQKKPCRFYAQGRCYYGHSCKYLHDSVEI
ncbi:hypothetical protein CQW23_15009 [Capsicum baccatum]|uniref:Zinc finger CCCH domain-containing protein 62 n=1 Tax=Capsicum baccatum TaxID=33114 RepID=A0A2G2WKU1_CAPBA|nr:hypothetical protein CQW23_15009 [Capsicum baccatum]